MAIYSFYLDGTNELIGNTTLTNYHLFRVNG